MPRMRLAVSKPSQAMPELWVRLERFLRREVGATTTATVPRRSD